MFRFPVAKLPSWLPGMGFKKHAWEMRKRLNTFIEAPFDAVYSQMVG
jgi:hypothetical protein